MKIKLRTLIAIWLIILGLVVWGVRSLTADLSGGQTAYTDRSLWQLVKYKYTALLREPPLCWCPFKSYVLVCDNVKVYSEGNYNWISVEKNLRREVREDATFNRQFARAFKVKGTRKQKIRQIYRYCYRTKYVAHVKYARDVFQSRKGDCAGVASAFYVLCRAKKIPVRYVIGWCGGECHAWNRVKIKGKWYWIDATLGQWIRRKLPSGYKVMEIW